MDLPRVTEILSPFSGVQYVPRKTLERASERGSAVHAICASIANGAWVPEDLIDSELKCYVSSFNKWREEVVKDFIIIEKRFCHPVFGYTGQLDFVVKDKNDCYVLVDLKTSSSHNKTYPLQMGAYYELLNYHGINVSTASLVYLNREGEYPKIYPVQDLEDKFKVFNCALQCWKYFKTREKHGRNRGCNREKHTSENASSDGGSPLHS